MSPLALRDTKQGVKYSEEMVNKVGWHLEGYRVYTLLRHVAISPEGHKARGQVQ
jgi:hypothetical protein